MNRKLIFSAILVGLLALSLGFVACDNGSTSSSGNLFTLTNITSAQISEGTPFCYVGLYPDSKNKSEVEADVAILLANSGTTSHIVAGRRITTTISAGGTISGTLLSAASTFTANWVGDGGSYHIWIGLNNGSTTVVYRTNSAQTLAANASTTLNAATDFAKQ